MNDKYENNPFLITTKGINLIFSKAKSVGIFMVVMSVIAAITGSVTYIFSPDDNDAITDGATDFFQQLNGNELLIISIVGAFFILGLILISTLISGIYEYTSMKVSKGESTTLPEAFGASLSRLWGYLWVQIVKSVKVFLWSLLFIVPGIIMAIRYSLAGQVFFDPDNTKRGNAAIKESAAMTKRAWLTTYASYTLLNAITLGVIQILTQSGSKAVLYRQLSKHPAKPEAHALSWLTLVFSIAYPLVLLSLFLLFIIGIVWLILALHS